MSASGPSVPLAFDSIQIVYTEYDDLAGLFRKSLLFIA